MARTVSIHGTHVAEYRMPGYPTGGVHGGHVLFMWHGDRAWYLVSVHDPTNRPRALAIAAALIADTTAA